MSGLLLVLLLVCLPVASLLGHLCRRDLDRSMALAEAALRHALEPVRGAPDTSGTGPE